MNEQAIPITVTLYGQQLAILDTYAQDEGFSRSLAARRIIDEWVQLKRATLVDAPARYGTRSWEDA